MYLTAAAFLVGFTVDHSVAPLAHRKTQIGPRATIRVGDIAHVAAQFIRPILNDALSKDLRNPSNTTNQAIHLHIALLTHGYTTLLNNACWSMQNLPGSTQNVILGTVHRR